MSYALTALVTVLFTIGLIFFASKENPEQIVDLVRPESKDITRDSAGDVAPTQVSDSRTTLDLSNQGLTKVPATVFNKTDIEELDLSGNKLDGALQAEVRHMQNLRVLDLSDNNFTGLPAEVGQLGKLEILDLSNNPITGLPYEIGNLKNLKVLDLRGTNYSEQDLGVIKQGLSASVEIRVD